MRVLGERELEALRRTVRLMEDGRAVGAVTPNVDADLKHMKRVIELHDELTQAIDEIGKLTFCKHLP